MFQFVAIDEVLYFPRFIFGESQPPYRVGRHAPRGVERRPHIMDLDRTTIMQSRPRRKAGMADESKDFPIRGDNVVEGDGHPVPIFTSARHF